MNDKSIINYYYNCLLFGIPGVYLGLIIESFFVYETKKKGKCFVLGIKQLLVNIFILYIIQVHISDTFASQWQENTPGIFFVAMFFGVQTTMYNNLSLV